MHNQKIVIIGASGQGKVAADIARVSGQYHNIIFLDDAPINECMGIQVMGKTSEVNKYLEEADFFVAVGNPMIRKNIIEELLGKDANVVSLIHPNAVIGTNVQVKEGTIVMAGAVLNPECKVGRGCIINTCASVDHDCVLGDYVHVSVGAHLAGAVTVGDATWIGAGVIVNNNLIIAEKCMIGSGAVVVRDLNKSATYIGVPAKEISSR